MPKGELTLMGVGDVLVTRPEPASIFAGVRDLFAQADFLFANQEGATSDRGEPILGKVESGSLHIRSVPGTVAAEKELGFSAVSLANNHMMDYGPEAMFQTIELLKEHGIAYTGAGANWEEAHRPAIVERGGTKIAMLGYTSVFPVAGYAAGPDTPGVATVKIHTSYQAPQNIFYQPGAPAIIITTPDYVEMQAMLDDVRRAREQADLVVVQFHWGVSQNFGRVCGYMKEMGRAAVDAGADLILGNHAHQLLGFEMYKERLICYSQGHFIFDVSPRYTRKWLDTSLLKATIRDGRFVRFAIVPACIDEQGWHTVLAQGDRVASIQQTIEELSKEYGTRLTREGDELVVDGPVPGTPPPLRAPEVLADSMLFQSWPTSRSRGLIEIHNR